MFPKHQKVYQQTQNTLRTLQTTLCNFILILGKKFNNGWGMHSRLIYKDTIVLFCVCLGWGFPKVYSYCMFMWIIFRIWKNKFNWKVTIPYFSIIDFDWSNWPKFLTISTFLNIISCTHWSLQGWLKVIYYKYIKFYQLYTSNIHNIKIQSWDQICWYYYDLLSFISVHKY